MILGVFQVYILPAIVLAVTGAIFGVLIAVLSKVFAVKIDERIVKVSEMLPGYNCGACGHPGCLGFATAVVNENVALTSCKPGRQEMRDKIKSYLEEYEKEHTN